ncbi:MAG: hypothetical protein ACR2Q4_05695 [Geminicoccaceae bacterium]
MGLRRDAWHVRLMGCLFGLGALGIGLLGIFGASPAAPLEQAGSCDFCMIAIATGVIALVGSLFTPNIRGLWFCNPERSRIAREALLADEEKSADR